MATFTVAAIAKEPWPILERFVRWHLDQGADRLILYLDDPNDPSLPRLHGDPRIEPRPCTPALWAGLGMAPDARFTRRQRGVYTQAYAASDTDWLLLLDADELMWLRDGIASTLSALSDDAMSLRVLSAEQVRMPDGSDVFRSPIPRKSVNRIYGADADLLRIRHGLVYHPEGKSFHRAGQAGLTIKLHWADGPDGARTSGPVFGSAERAHLVHYAAPSYDRWRAKVDWRAGAHGFSQPVKDRVAEVAENADPETGYRTLYETLHSLTEDRAAALEAEGGLLREAPV